MEFLDFEQAMFVCWLALSTLLLAGFFALLALLWRPLMYVSGAFGVLGMVLAGVMLADIMIALTREVT